MDVGLALPQFDFSVRGERPLRWATVVAWARRAEELGFSSVWLGDHLFWDAGRYGGPAEHVGALDPTVSLAALARVTSSLRLGTLTLCAPLRPSLVLAKSLATLDCLSGGRLTIGIGAGWYEPEFAAAGIPFERAGLRLAHLGATITALREAFDGEVPLASLPRPRQQPAPPIWIGGKGGDRLLDLVVRHADGWNTVWVWSPRAYGERVAALGRACERIGRDPASVALSVGLYTLVGENEDDLARRFERLRVSSPPGVLDRTALADWRRDRLVGTVEQVREQVGEWASVGVTSLIVCVGAVPFAVTDVGDLDTVAAACNL